MFELEEYLKNPDSEKAAGRSPKKVALLVSKLKRKVKNEGKKSSKAPHCSIFQDGFEILRVFIGKFLFYKTMDPEFILFDLNFMDREFIEISEEIAERFEVNHFQKNML